MAFESNTAGPQVPMLDVNTSAPLHCRHSLTEGHDTQHRRRECTKSMAKRLSEAEAREKLALSPFPDMSRLWEAYGEGILSLEQTLDEYCHHSLGKDELDSRDRDQVLSRYYKELAERNQTSTGVKVSSEAPSETPITESDGCADDTAPIVVVSNLLVWRLGGQFSLPVAFLLSHGGPPPRSTAYITQGCICRLTLSRCCHHHLRHWVELYIR